MRVRFRCDFLEIDLVSLYNNRIHIYPLRIGGGLRQGQSWRRNLSKERRNSRATLANQGCSSGSIDGSRIADSKLTSNQQSGPQSWKEGRTTGLSLGEVKFSCRAFVFDYFFYRLSRAAALTFISSI